MLVQVVEFFSPAGGGPQARMMNMVGPLHSLIKQTSKCESYNVGRKLVDCCRQSLEGGNEVTILALGYSQRLAAEVLMRCATVAHLVVLLMQMMSQAMKGAGGAGGSPFGGASP